MVDSISLKSQDFIASSSLSELTFYSDKEFINLDLKCDGKFIFSNKYFTSGGFVNVTELNEIAELYLRKNGLSFAYCELDVSDADSDLEIAFKVLYCESKVDIWDISEWVKSQFLTLSECSIIYDDEWSLSIFKSKGENLSYEVYVNYITFNGILKSASYIRMNSQNNDTEGVISLGESAGSVLNKIKAIDKDVLKIISFSVNIGIRSFSFFINEIAQNVKFFKFRNSFNIVESFAFQCVTKNKITSNRQVASLGYRKVLYDIFNKREFITESAPIHQHQINAAEELIKSKSVMILNDNSEYANIIINDFECEFNDSNSELNSFSFTWEFDDKFFPIFFNDRKGVFNDSFNNVFN